MCGTRPGRPCHPNGYHVWMPLPQGWIRTDLSRRGLSVVASDSFVVRMAPSQAIRLGLGAARTREDLASALTLRAATLRQSGGTSTVV